MWGVTDEHVELQQWSKNVSASLFMQYPSDVSCIELFRLLSRRHDAALADTLCLAVTRHAVTPALAHLEASPLAVTALPFPCMFFSRVSHSLAPHSILIWRWQRRAGGKVSVFSSCFMWLYSESAVWLNKVTLMWSGNVLYQTCEWIWVGLLGQFHSVFRRFRGRDAAGWILRLTGVKKITMQRDGGCILPSRS